MKPKLCQSRMFHKHLKSIKNLKAIVPKSSRLFSLPKKTTHSRILQPFDQLYNTSPKRKKEMLRIAHKVTDIFSSIDSRRRSRSSSRSAASLQAHLSFEHLNSLCTSYSKNQGRLTSRETDENRIGYVLAYKMRFRC